MRLLVVVVMAVAFPSGAVAQQVGPSSGALVVVGGGSLEPAIFEEFIELAGGAGAPIVVIPTAGARDHYGQYWPGTRRLREAGATNLTVLHTRDRAVANSEEFVAPLKTARGVWLSGGRQWRLVDSYLGTRVHEELWALLRRGGVIGGTSAGATIQGSYLVRGDTQTNTIMMGDHEEGLGFLRDVAVDQHLLKRNRQFDLLEVIEAHPDLLGIGLDENTAIVVQGDMFRVIGQSYVAIYDYNRRLDSGGRFYLLAPGDRFDLKARQAYRMAPSPEPFERVKTESWQQR